MCVCRCLCALCVCGVTDNNNHQVTCHNSKKYNFRINGSVKRVEVEVEIADMVLYVVSLGVFDGCLGVLHGY